MKLLLLFIFLLLTQLSFSQNIIEHFKIYDTKTKQLISIDKIVADCATADVLFFGDDHNDSAVHYLEAEIFKALNSLSKDAKKFLPPLPYDTLSGRYREKFVEVMKGTPGSSSPNIYYSQSLWDAGMSYSIYSYWKKNKDKKIFHCVGNFHCDEKLGTMAQLQKRKS